MWGQITVGCRSMGSQSASMLSSEGARRAMVAELLTFTIALKNHLRDEETSRSELAAAEAARGTFSFDGSGEPHDLHALATSPSPHNRIVAALSVTIRQGLRREEDILAPPAYLWFCEQLHALTAAATACERIKSSPMPLGCDSRPLSPTSARHIPCPPHPRHIPAIASLHRIPPPHPSALPLHPLHTPRATRHSCHRRLRPPFLPLALAEHAAVGDDRLLRLECHPSRRLHLLPLPQPRTSRPGDRAALRS